MEETVAVFAKQRNKVFQTVGSTRKRRMVYQLRGIYELPIRHLTCDVAVAINAISGRFPSTRQRRYVQASTVRHSNVTFFYKVKFEFDDLRRTMTTSNEQHRRGRTVVTVLSLSLSRTSEKVERDTYAEFSQTNSANLSSVESPRYVKRTLAKNKSGPSGGVTPESRRNPMVKK